MPAVSVGTALGAGVRVVIAAAVAPRAGALGIVFGAAAGLTLGAAVEAARIRRRRG